VALALTMSGLSVLAGVARAVRFRTPPRAGSLLRAWEPFKDISNVCLLKGFRHMAQVIKAVSAIVCFALVGGLAAPLFAAPGNAKKGKAVFANCTQCHNADSADAKNGPGLKDLFKHKKLVNGKPVTVPNVRELITNGSNQMPAFDDKTISPREKDDLVAYLQTL
jgi:cytochrome c